MQRLLCFSERLDKHKNFTQIQLKESKWCSMFILWLDISAISPKNKSQNTMRIFHVNFTQFCQERASHTHIDCATVLGKCMVQNTDLMRNRWRNKSIAANELEYRLLNWWRARARIKSAHCQIITHVFKLKSTAYKLINLIFNQFHKLTIEIEGFLL